MLMDDNGSESGVSSETSTESTSSSESAAPAQTQDEAGKQEASQNTEKTTPFHEHPRFKELVEQKNAYAQRMQEFERQAAQMREQMQTMQRAQEAYNNSNKSKPYQRIFEELEKADPEFAKMQQELYDKASSTQKLEAELKEFKQWRQEMELQRTRSEAESKLNSLYEANKVPENLRSMYRSQIENLAYNNPNSSISDLEKFFKSTHDQMSKFMDEFKRNERASYVSDKKKDVTPATQTGGQAASPKSGNPFDSVEGRIKAVTQALREGKTKI